MNFLAHMYLSFSDPEILIGQFISDDVKGSQYLNYPLGIQNGILLHRYVDDQTDKHPDCRLLRSKLRSNIGLYTPVAMDVYFDHILARDWNKYSNTSLPQFLSDSYEVLNASQHHMPDKSRMLYTKMVEYDWISKYADLSGMMGILRQMAKRVPRGSALDTAASLLPTELKNIELAFNSFFPELIDGTKRKLDTFANKGLGFGAKTSDV
jgi:acyl carrier protein phosphodiesterase